ncbi:serine hydrolase domain-containing protein [Adhaeribacter radiodurans]|uniref:Beta-lactamase family protein n=1 Tax=Adhaeribacter radiodurans TaxID=2745197 RepID=A0A7L7L6I4_9BACT|nr:serine hydrolase domain-containing protein [Adhaeribacter radiodurans]QMU28446.1 beta-lactamase family protein [Adhaeribacter radiodurans]
MQLLKFPVLIGLILVSFSHLVNAQPRHIAIPATDSIKHWQNKFHVPLVSVGIIEKGQIKETKVLGELPSGMPAPAATFFNIASLTKPVVGMLILQLVSKKQWNLDQPLSDFFVDPDLAQDERHHKLTTRIVLAHQTGLPNWRGNNPNKKMTFAFEPGTQVAYSGEGYMYLGHALEHNFNRSLKELADSLLFKPLGMKNTRFYWDSKINESYYAGRHDKSGKLLEMEKWYEANAANLLLTTIEDYCKFGVSVLQRKGISKKVYQEMTRPQLPKRMLTSRQLGTNYTFGLSWVLYPNLSNGEMALVHSGSNPGLNTFILLLPKSQRGLVIFTNGENGRELYNKIISNTLDLGEEFLSRSSQPMLTR